MKKMDTVFVKRNLIFKRHIWRYSDTPLFYFEWNLFELQTILCKLELF